MKTRPCDCGVDVCAFECDSEPCYGTLCPVEAKEFEGRGYVDTVFLHACVGHAGRRYVPEGEA